ncbi:MAG: CoA ester lyase [Gammaproteobacteria bacterium]|nr:CoA ester lyase [Gammaproteobacteria bacterium]MXW45010.1 CoA ester lyase [Gammaproteobacteria bacterium]MYD01684.1 CoA ester lyase [Gammaproteobacteria bacterium]MYI25412.1 CoA ester lyase [Gammaproteobacteria bacterium]
MKGRRSWLFVPGDSERKLAKGPSTGADILILDVEDSVSPARKPVARKMIAEYLGSAARDGAPLWVRINGLHTPYWRDDMDAAMAGSADGIVLPKPRSTADVFAVAEWMERLEVSERSEPAKILALAGETARGLMSLHEYRPGLPRLTALSWGSEDLGTDVGALRRRREDGSLLPLYEVSRALTLAAATVAEVDAIEAVYADFRNLDGFRQFTKEALEMGYVGGAAIHPAQVEILNEVFTPSGEQLAEAREIVEAFEASGETGVMSIRGKMVDQPHLAQARKLLRRYDSASE